MRKKEKGTKAHFQYMVGDPLQKNGYMRQWLDYIIVKISIIE